MVLSHYMQRRPALTSFVAGALFALCFAPFYVVPLLFVCVPVLFQLTRTAPSAKQALRNGFLFGYGFFIAGTYWIAFSLLVDANAHAWLVPFSVLGLSALLALYFAPIGWLMHRLRNVPVAVAALVFIGCWVALEWLRGQGMLGFPWNLAGYIIGVSNNLSQLVAYVGMAGATACVLLVGLLPWLAWAHVPTKRLRAMGAVAAVALIGAIYLLGAMRIPDAVNYTDTQLRIVQPNIAQRDKWTPEGKLQAYQRLRALSTVHTAGDAPDIVVWPETAIPAVMYSETNWQHLLDKFVPKGATLLAGILRESEEGALHNSVVAVADGSAPEYYDKRQLVPFGEFIPFGEWLGFLPIAHMPAGFSRGESSQYLAVGKAQKILPLICYEAVFSRLANNSATQPDWLLNVTNDAWFGDSPGPFQHFDMVRFRAIEQGVPVVRAANTGISAVIDSYGRVVQQLSLGAKGSLDARLPAKIIH